MKTPTLIRSITSDLEAVERDARFQYFRHGSCRWSPCHHLLRQPGNLLDFEDLARILAAALACRVSTPRCRKRSIAYSRQSRRLFREEPRPVLVEDNKVARQKFPILVRLEQFLLAEPNDL